MIRRTIGLGLCFAAIVSTRAWAQGPGPRAFVLDSEAHSLTAIDVASGKTLNTAVLQGLPGAIVQVPGGRWLVVLDRGPGSFKGDEGFQAKTKSAATIVDAATLAVMSRVELCWGLEFAPMLSPSGDRVSLVCPGYQAKKPQEVLPAELVTLELPSGRVAGRLPLPRPATAFIGTPDGKTAIVLSGNDKPRQTPALPAELRLVDLATSTVAATLTLEGDPRDPVVSPDGKFVYVLDRGKPSGNPEKNVNGRLSVVSIDARKVDATLDAGSKPRGLVLDEAGQQLLLLSDDVPVKGAERNGELRVIRGPAVQPPIKVAKNPLFLRAAPKAQRLFAVGEVGVTVLELPGLKTLSSIATGYNPNEFAINPEGKRGFMLWTERDNVDVYDLEGGKKIDSVRTGRMSALLLNATTAALATEASKGAGQRTAVRNGQKYYSYTEYTLRDPTPTIAVHPSGNFAYVLNSRTRDVTIVDATNATSVEKIGGAGFDMQFLNGGAVLAILSDSVVRLIDTAANKKLEHVAGGTFKRDEGFKALEVSPDGKYALAHGAGGVLSLDASTGKVVAYPVSFKRVSDVAFVW